MEESVEPMAAGVAGDREARLGRRGLSIIAAVSVILSSNAFSQSLLPRPPDLFATRMSQIAGERSPKVRSDLLRHQWFWVSKKIREDVLQAFWLLRLACTNS